MPGLDSTGPAGEGPMTGRKMGVCAQTSASSGNDAAPASGATGNATNNGVIYGLGRGGIPCGCGRGRCAGGRRQGRGGMGSRFAGRRTW